MGRLSLQNRILIRKAMKDKNKPKISKLTEMLGVSPSTIQRWQRNGKLEDLPRRKGTGVVTLAEDQLFKELLKLTRYTYQHLVQYLYPLKTALRYESGDVLLKDETSNSSDAWTCAWDNPSYYNYLYKDRAGLLKVYDHVKPLKASVAAHSIKVTWKDILGKAVKGKVLLLFDRQTGFLYAKAFTTRINTPSFAKAISRFSQMLPYQIRSINFVASYLTNQPGPKTLLFSSCLNLRSKPEGTATILGGRDWQKPSTSSELSSDSLTRLHEHIDSASLQKTDVLLDPPTPLQSVSLTIPGTHASRVELDRKLEALCNTINLTPRSYTKWGRTIDVTPVNKLHEESFTKSRDDIVLRIKLPRDFKYNYNE